ncbi:MAG TPA: CorA family divalent cation transporter, partial [Dongiaceae bacterium]|nr:CorA family divalent cation transporter [Dongiaceae bacterium]
MGPVINCAIYEGGLKIRDLDINNPEDMTVQTGRVIWIGLHEPSQELLSELQREFKLHELAIEDAYKAHQRPKIEIYGETLFVAMKTFQRVGEEFAMGETCVFVGRGYVITVRHGPSRSYAAVRARCENSPNMLRQGEDFILYALMDFIVDNY